MNIFYEMNNKAGIGDTIGCKFFLFETLTTNFFHYLLNRFSK